MKDHEYRKTVLDNGVTVHSINIPSAARTYYEVMVTAGSNNETADKTGVAHYLEHMLGYGSEEYGEQDLLPYFNRVGGHYNFGTGPDRTLYFACALPHKIDEFSNRIASVLTAPTFKPQHVDLERGPIATEELQKRTMMMVNPYVRITQEIFKGSRYAIPVIGMPEHISKINYEDLRAYYEGAYVASNMHVIVVGDIEHEEWVQKTGQQYATLSQRPSALPREPLHHPSGTFSVPMDSGSVQFTLGMAVPKVSMDQSVKDSIFCTLLSHRLHQVLREEKKLVYQINASFEDNGYDRATFISTPVDPSRMEEVTRTVFDTIVDYIKNADIDDVAFYTANEEENIADNYTNVYKHGQDLSHVISIGQEYLPLNHMLGVARTLTKTDLQEAGKRLFSGRIFGAFAGRIEQVPAMEPYIERAKAELGIEEKPQTPYIRREFNP